MVETGAVLRLVQRNAKGKIKSSYRVLVFDVNTEGGVCEVIPYDDQSDSAPEMQLLCSELDPLLTFEHDMLLQQRDEARVDGKTSQTYLKGQLTICKASSSCAKDEGEMSSVHPWLLAGKQAGNAVFALKDFRAAIDIYCTVLNHMKKRDVRQIALGSTVLFQRSKKLLRATIKVRERVKIPVNKQDENNNNASVGGKILLGYGCGASKRGRILNAQSQDSLRKFMFHASTADGQTVQLFKRDIVGVIPSSSAEASLQVNSEHI